MATHTSLTSLQNQKVKRILSLRERKERDATGFTIIEGVREIQLAFDCGIRFEEIFVCPELIAEDGVRAAVDGIASESKAAYKITKPVFKKVAFGNRLEGVLAVCRYPTYALEDLLLAHNPLVVVVEKVEKPGNLGAILRTADAAGVDGLIICDGATDIYNPNVIRASIGTVFSVKTIQTSNKKALQFLKDNSVTICATTPHAHISYADVDCTAALAILLGSEQDGLSDFWLEHSDIQAALPMRGKADSLNVSTSAAITIFEALRQRTQQP
ncbi:TrmH family RNA methyltransferase [Candidatus Omnitrophota bacterium]